MTQTPGVLSGNAAEGSDARWGWLLGHFMPEPDDPRATGDVEVKWAVYDGGEARTAWGVNAKARTLAVLVRGRFLLRFPQRDVVLTHEGDYVLWEPGVPHLWRAESAAVVITVRWPSLPGDSRTLDDDTGAWNHPEAE
ncbi:MAG: hypothetical protein U0031_11165 [Thermomicrobiales bacterium]